MIDKISFQSANVLPIKIIYDRELTESMLTKKKIIPRVIQITPTNACDLKCQYCCCNDIDRSESLTLNQIKEIFDITIKIGVKAVVITGGGEPLLHPHILDIIEYGHAKGLKLSLITNGNHFKFEMINTLKKLEWCRISFDDDRILTDKYKQTLEVCQNIPNVNFSFSYMYKGNHNSEFLRIIKFLNENDNFSHCRVVNDSLSEKYLNTLDAKEYIESNGLETKKCFFKKQQIYFQGQEKCYMSILKPRIVANGMVYPCCAIQYQEANGLRMYNPDLAMGHYTDLPKIIEKQAYFRGDICNQCYYENYNQFLGYFLEDKIQDKEFI